MSENWTYVCAIGELLPGEMKTAWDEVTSVAIVVFNHDGAYYALEDRCSHEEFELSVGTYNADEASIECVLHGARFDIRDGRPLCAPAYAGVSKFPVKLEHDAVWTRDDRD